MFPSRLLLLALLVLLQGAAAACHGSSAAAPAGPEPPAPAALVLVRHAETEPDGSPDPALSVAGRERARALAERLRDAGVVRILSTDLRRTRGTAGPLSTATGVAVETYDPFALDVLAGDLLAEGPEGVVVVVGHSNTTPALVAELGGQPGPEIPEWEHDRLYVLLPAGGGPEAGPRASGVRTLRLRYGAPSVHRPD